MGEDSRPTGKRWDYGFVVNPVGKYYQIKFQMVTTNQDGSQKNSEQTVDGLQCYFPENDKFYFHCDDVKKNIPYCIRVAHHNVGGLGYQLTKFADCLDSSEHAFDYSWTRIRNHQKTCQAEFAP